MAETTIVQHWLLSQFILPFLLVWFVAFAILEKTKLLGGEGKTQLNAMTAAVLAAIFVGALAPKMIVTNMVLFLTVAIIVVFVGLLLWGFVSGSDLSKDIFTGKLKWVAGIIVFASVVLALTWSSGINNLGVFSALFSQSWSQTFWTNVAFIAVVAGVIAGVLWKNA